MSNDKLIVTELDYDSIKQNLKTFLKDNPAFTDFDFEGSALSTLLNVLAYNTHYNSVYTNLLANETFLDTAVKRSSVVSHAGKLGYTPSSCSAPQALIRVSVIGVPPSVLSLTLPRGSIFGSTISGTTYEFVVTDTQTSDSNFVFNNVKIKEGKLISNSFLVNNTENPSQRFQIPNENIDTKTLRVYVRDSSSSSRITEFKLVDDVYDIKSDSNVYYLEETFDGGFGIYFGDGILGKKLDNNNIVKMEYVVTNKSSANGCRVFTFDGSIGSYSNITITTSEVATGGSDKESIDEIKFNAPKLYAAQKHTVTTTDYEAFLRKYLENLESVSVWGGEDNVPPIYGKVFISLKPMNGYYYSESTKQNTIREYLKRSNVVTVRPEFVDPEYLFVTLTSEVKYTKDTTTLSGEQIKAEVYQTILAYFQANLERFNTNLRYSRLVESIDSAEQSIVSNLTSIILSKRISNIRYGASRDYNLKYNNPLIPNTITSTPFNVFIGTTNTLVSLKDDAGTNTIMAVDSSGRNVSTLGTIDYTTGTIDFVVAVYDVSSVLGNIIVYAKPLKQDISVTRNQIIVLDDSQKLIGSNRMAGVEITVVESV
jgi:hypothetical protein